MEIRQWIREGRVVNVSPSLEGENWYASKVTDVGIKSFSIAPPKKLSDSPAWEPGRKIRISVPSTEGLFQFICDIRAKGQGPEVQIEVDFPKEVTHMERRAFPRLPFRKEIQYAEIRDSSRNLSFARSTTLDISGGGVRMETSRVCPQETLVRLKFQIPLGAMEEELILTGRIVRSISGEGARKSQVGVEFIDITPHQQESLVQFILDQTKDQRPQA
jgi:c-di-GMP-binding flagellar brake protein YcgR